jgi:hypothetical protein
MQRWRIGDVLVSRLVELELAAGRLVRDGDSDRLDV